MRFSLTTITIQVVLQATEAAEAELDMASEAQKAIDAESDARRSAGALALLEGGFVDRAVAAHDRKVAL